MASTFTTLSSDSPYTTFDIVNDDDTGHTLNGSAGADTLNGNGGNDTINGGLGQDSLNGGADNDYFNVNAANEVVAGEIYDGGSGTDTIQYNGGDTVDFSGTTFVRFENFYNYGGAASLTSAQLDQFTANLYGGFTLTNAGTVTIGAGASLSSVTIQASANGNTVNLAGASGAASFHGGAGIDIFTGADGGDIIYASGGTDTLDGALGNDYFYINDPDEVQAGDSFIGGSGSDSLQINTSSNVSFVGSTLSGIENLYGYGGAVVLTAAQLDGLSGSLYGIFTITGGGSANLAGSSLSSFTVYVGSPGTSLNLTGATGSANMQGLDAADTLIGSDGGDQITGGGAADSLAGGLGNDTFNITSATDIVAGESYDGGGDIDTIVNNAPSPVSMVGATIANVENFTNYGAAVTLTAAHLNGLNGSLYGQFTLSGAGSANLSGSSLSSFVLRTSSAGNNVNMTGASGSAQVLGGEGNDTVTGGDGGDGITGGLGIDVLSGGVGNDVLYVHAPDEVGAGESYGGGTDTDRIEYDGSGPVSFLGTTISGMEGFTNYSAFRIGLTASQISGFSDQMYGSFQMDSTGTADLAGTALSSFNLKLNAGGNTVDLSSVPYGTTVIGDVGDDTYIITADIHTLTEGLDGGTDLVMSSVTYTLKDNFENLTLTGADTISGTGNALNNKIIGNSAANTLSGLAGNDTLNGGGGADTMIGGTDNDSYYVNTAADVITETAGQGTDTVNATASYTLAAGVSVEVLRADPVASTTAINLTGNEVAQAVLGNDGKNTLDGKAGADTMTGYGGNDTYKVDNAADQVLEAAGKGSDTVNASASWVLSAGQAVEVLQTNNAAGTTAINLAGNDFAQALYGNAGANTLDGRGGADLMAGYAGNDTYRVDNFDDRVIEAAGGGSDTVYATVSFTLAAGQSVELLRANSLADTTAIALTGNEIAQRIGGNAGHNTLDGKAGADTMTGYGGDDTYLVDNAGDQVIEVNGQGSDTVFATTGYTLAAGQSVEQIAISSIAGTTSVNLTGNEIAQVIGGNHGTNTLDGKGGADTMIGYRGDDTYRVDSASDRVIEAADAGSDTVYASTSFALGAGQSVELLRTDANAGTTAINLNGNEFAQRLSGNAGANTLDGKGGADTMTGYGGHDTYKVDNGADQVIEASGGGSDTVYAATSYTLATGVYVEQLRTNAVAGTTAINLTGNEVAQSLYGNAGANILTGAGGADTMTGYGGNDTYRVDLSTDKVIEAAGGGSDTVSASASYTLATGQSVERLQASSAGATTAINLTGNELNNEILGNAGANALKGFGGQDILDVRVDTAQDIVIVSSVGHSTSTARDIIKNFDFTEDKFDFSVVPGAVGYVTAGTLSEGASFDAQMKAAVDLTLAVDGAVLFDVTAGGLTGHTFLVVDANHDGVYIGGSDYVVELVGATGGSAALTTSDFI